MKKDELAEIDAVVERVLGGGKYEVRLILDSDVIVLRTAVVSGKMKKFFIKIVPGDMVKVEIPPFGDIVRINYRYPAGKRREQGAEAA